MLLASMFSVLENLGLLSLPYFLAFVMNEIPAFSEVNAIPLTELVNPCTHKSRMYEQAEEARPRCCARYNHL